MHGGEVHKKFSRITWREGTTCRSRNRAQV